MNSATQIKLLPIVCRPSSRIAYPHRLAMASGLGERIGSIRVLRKDAGPTCRPAVRSQDVSPPVIGADERSALIALPYSVAGVHADIYLGEELLSSINAPPVPEFAIALMPTSHLCFGYNACLPEHIEAERVLLGFLDALEENPTYRFSVEFVRGAEKLLSMHPELVGRMGDLYRSGRLSIGAQWTSSHFENFDAESAIRQLTYAQWWLRDTLGAVSPLLLGCDSAGFDPQQPQMMRRCGIDFYWRCRYTLDEKRWGSPLFQHRGIDGSLLLCYTSRPPISSGYCWLPLRELSSAGTWNVEDPAAFVSIVRRLDDYLSASADHFSERGGFHFVGTDQSHADPQLIERITAWNDIFQIPRAVCASMDEATGTITTMPAPRIDEIVGEQPNWAAVGVAGYPLTRMFRDVACALVAAEKASAFDFLMNGTPYPAREIDASWLNLLDDQHHEQLGYGCMEWVNHTRERLTRGGECARDILHCACRRIAEKVDVGDARPTGTASRSGDVPVRDVPVRDVPVTVFNFFHWERQAIATVSGIRGHLDLPGARVVDSEGRCLPSELTESGDLRFPATVPGLGYATYFVQASGSAPQIARSTEYSIENEFYRLELDPRTGSVRSLYDKQLEQEVLKERHNWLPFEFVVLEDSGNGYCVSWPTGKQWRMEDSERACVRRTTSALTDRLTVQHPLPTGDPGGSESRVSQVCIEYCLSAGLKRVDVSIDVDWDSPPKRELRMMLPVVWENARLSYDTLLSVGDYDPALPVRQEANMVELEDNRIKSKKPIDYRCAARFVSLYNAEHDCCLTCTVPAGMFRLADGIVAFTLLEDRTDCYWDGLLPALTGRHTFHMTLTSHQGDWRSGKDYRLAWEEESEANGLHAVLVRPTHPVLAPCGELATMRGEHSVLTALKQAHNSNDVVVRAVDFEGTGDRIGFRWNVPYAGLLPSRIDLRASQRRRQGAGYGTDMAGKEETGTPQIDEYSPLAATAAFRVNDLEDPVEPLSVSRLAGDGVPLKPYEMCTVRLQWELPDQSWKTIFGAEKS